jgi:hypothetical protein
MQTESPEGDNVDIAVSRRNMERAGPLGVLLRLHIGALRLRGRRTEEQSAPGEGPYPISPPYGA